MPASEMPHDSIMCDICGSHFLLDNEHVLIGSGLIGWIVCLACAAAIHGQYSQRLAKAIPPGQPQSQLQD